MNNKEYSQKSIPYFLFKTIILFLHISPYFNTIQSLSHVNIPSIAVRGNNQVNGNSNWVSLLPTFAASWEYFKKNEGNRHAYYRNAFAQIPDIQSLAEEYNTSLMAENGRTNYRWT